MLFLVALLVGCLLAVQASVNLQLNRAVGTPYGASTVQLTVAAVLLAILATAVGTIDAVSLDVPWWHLLGGLASPLYITSGILLFPRLGALAAVGLFVTGQMFASLALDLFGLIGVPQHPPTFGIAVGAVAVLAGITVIIRAGGATFARGQIGWILLGIAAGAVLPVQGAINAQLRTDLHAPITVAMISFIVATIAIALVLLVRRNPKPQLEPLAKMPWWGWLGGVCAAAYVTATFLLIPQIGASTTVALTVTGQQLFSALIDNSGLFRMPKRPLTTRRITGLGLLIAGSVLVQLT
jgi:bacterial/archaeal transporter family-2 protein